MAQIAILWVMSKGFNPLLGLAKQERINEAVAVIGKSLTEEEIKNLEEPYMDRAVTHM